MRNLVSTKEKTKTKRRSKKLVDYSVGNADLWVEPQTTRGKELRLLRKNIILVVLIIAAILVLNINAINKIKSQESNTPKSSTVGCLWEICSIDTMKTSRDKARDYLNDSSYDKQISNQLKLIKETGANYVAIDTPYDEEFLPYLKRWVSLARAHDLKVWFRGNWSNWEGWFGYPKNLTPDEHIKKTVQFIKDNPYLFEDGDIFDSCPECENAGHWPQPNKNSDYQKFIQKQHSSLKAAFEGIDKNVQAIPSIIGGRAKDVLNKQTFDSLGNTIAIDHYVKTSKDMEDYVDYFNSKFQTKTLVSEFGAPIPDLNGGMNEKQQADFVRQILEGLFRKGGKVYGFNYWVLSDGTTELINTDGSTRPVYNVLKEYFSPGEIRGNVENPLGEKLEGITVKTSDNSIETKTDQNGFYQLKIPQRKVEIKTDHPDYDNQNFSVIIDRNGRIIDKNFTLHPNQPGILYKLKLWWQELSN